MEKVTKTILFCKLCKTEVQSEEGITGSYCPECGVRYNFAKSTAISTKNDYCGKCISLNLEVRTFDSGDIIATCRKCGNRFVTTTRPLKVS